MDKNLQGWQLEIVGLILGWGKYHEVARIAIEHGEEGVLFAMQAMHKAGFNDAIGTVIEAAQDARRKRAAENRLNLIRSELEGRDEQ